MTRKHRILHGRLWMVLTPVILIVFFLAIKKRPITLIKIQPIKSIEIDIK